MCVCACACACVCVCVCVCVGVCASVRVITQRERGNKQKKKFMRNSCLPVNKSVAPPKGPDGKWTRKPLAYRESNNVHLHVTRPPEICVNLVFKHIHAASSYTIRR